MGTETLIAVLTGKLRLKIQVPTKVSWLLNGKAGEMPGHVFKQASYIALGCAS
jgi:hypothetical protein